MSSIKNVIKKIKNTKISEVISRYIPIEKKNCCHVGKCPFHNDSRKSLYINDSSNLFRCPACKASGDAISFVQRYKKLSFQDAVEKLKNNKKL